MRTRIFLGLALAMTLGGTLAAQAPADPAALPSGNLYRDPAINKALGLTPEQAAQLDRITNQVQTKFAADVNKLGGVTVGERVNRVQELRRQYEAAWIRAAQEVFNQNQLNRYRQLQYQQGGFDTLADPDVQRRINLTEEQRRALAESIAWSQQQMADLGRLPPTERARALEMYRDYRGAYQDRFGRFLTAEQMRLWREMTGEPYEFPPPFPVDQPRP